MTATLAKTDDRKLQMLWTSEEYMIVFQNIFEVRCFDTFTKKEWCLIV